MYIKAGDTVVVITGKDKDKFQTDKKGNVTRKTGRVLKVYPKTDRVLVEGINIVKKHERPTQANQKGSVVEKEAPIHVSNVAIVDPKSGLPTRVGYKEVNGLKVRYAKKSGELLDKAKGK
ncbi:50S ribosomal protein L24 [Acholeplasma sp. OttesenSCG-928-E16]|nr:50S ribosomal protein L24 [Acholeplasma sp. OttesenSCG-928-E16]